MQNKSKYSLTLSPVRPTLSAVNKTSRQKLASLAFQAIAYAILGLLAFWFFIVTQF